ncbi:MAG: glutamate--cysteine ligase [Deltaproteobacteria bacterium]|nr:glutamate--cysteine ligase [Deltaproteobacteria bacterium]MBW2542365.1 glutamate--cysteine ligase [Deltaproteobacteria bacterium]
MSGIATLTPEKPIESVEDLVAFLRAGEKPPEAWRVGTEHEKIGLHAAELSPVDYEGECGIGQLLQRIADRAGWEPIYEDGNVIALQHEGASITLEPGGQLELSGAPLRTIFETCAEFHAHLELVRSVSEPMGLVWLGLGIHPIHAAEQLPQMPKERYRIMRRYLPTRGSRALIMMFTTATVQANFDYQSETDMVEKVRTALAISPIVSAIFANSSLSEGKANGFISRRMHAWTDTDPDRCGMLPIAFESDFGYRRYVDWALDVPMFFIVRKGRFEPAYDMTFRQFLENGRKGERATLADFDRHLTTLFPEVRVKQFIEVRCADAVPSRLTCSLPALWKGILYDATARAAAANLVEAEQAEREAAAESVSRLGLAAHYAGRPILDLARELVEIARGGLERIGHAGPSAPDESAFLDPIFAQLALEKSPGQVVLECWEGEWERSFERLIEYARY